MSDGPLIRYPIIQHAFFVNDLEEAARKWTRLTGAGPFFITPHHMGDKHLYRGNEMTADVGYAFGQHGPTHVQFICQYDDEPSIYRDMYGCGEEGFHHIGCLVPDPFEEAKRYERLGFPTASSLWSLADVVYIDTRPALGCFLELHGDSPEIRDVFKRFEDAARGWDGVTEPIRGNRGQQLDR